MIVLDAGTGAEAARLPLCADPDDVFVDARRHRLYVACGSGQLAVFEAVAGGYALNAEIPTAKGARTALFAPDLDLLFVAARAAGGRGAEVLVFRPQP